MMMPTVIVDENRAGLMHELERTTRCMVLLDVDAETYDEESLQTPKHKHEVLLSTDLSCLQFNRRREDKGYPRQSACKSHHQDDPR